ncbi:hypothetical protein QFZ63_002724 [Streptomyces sp. B3I7]|uniref:hypothetical protein n=1 Tax=Streptomyces sp. B3I7 TaxID=3042269 RepID=UPI002784B1B9|nr:hypothetical protein [Streptomyces sp. B3I7]MDQ0811010.1 hypothetical protein [Streptomyces sp. B3I7]
MGSKTVDEAGATVTGAEAKPESGADNAAEAKNGAGAADGTATAKADAVPPTAQPEETAAEKPEKPEERENADAAQAGDGAARSLPADSADHAEDPADPADSSDGTARTDGPNGVGQGAGAVVSAALGVVSLTGGWVGTVASARETLVGQLHTSSSANVATQIKEVYGDAWHAAALWGGFFALLALVVGVVVLARPAFGAPGRPQAAWIKSVAWGGVALGVLGLLLAVAKYTDILLGLPSAS